jgi:NADPH:quinone reductase-like Zn-dependent oxidoreductase
MEAWRTYTPDGRMLEVEYAAGRWVANCGGTRGVGASAVQAIRDAIGTEEATVGGRDAALEAWVAAHAAQLESEAS